MKGKPIIFTTRMVQALLNTKPGAWPAEPIDPAKPHKGMTRRVIEPQPRYQLKEHKGSWHEYSENPMADPIVKSPWGYGYPCKYKVGDLLWVRETTAIVPYGSEIGIHDRRVYKASILPGDFERNDGDKWVPSIHMPREAARIFLEVKSVRVEQLQDITEEDGIAEGMLTKYEATELGVDYVQVFFNLWEKLNAKRGYPWETNPWVWVYEFVRVEGA